jgi:hypothetical protein
VGDGHASGWTTPEHALGYLERADTLPHRDEGAFCSTMVRWTSVCDDRF